MLLSWAWPLNPNVLKIYIYKRSGQWLTQLQGKKNTYTHTATHQALILRRGPKNGSQVGHGPRVWDPRFRSFFWHVLSQSQNLKCLDFAGLCDWRTSQFSRIFQTCRKTIRLHTDWGFSLVNYCSPQFPEWSRFAFLRRLSCVVALSLHDGYPHTSLHLMENCGDVILALLHIWGVQWQSGGSCNRLKCQYRLMHNVC